MTVPRIVIVGGGFGGVYTARHLERLLRPDEAEIVLVNRTNYFVFQPLLPEIISGSINLTDVVSPIRRLCPRTALYMRDVERVDLGGRSVSLAPAIRPRSLELAYDYLVVAVGRVNDFSSMPGVPEHALAFRSLGDALRLRNHVLQALEEAETEDDPEFRRRLLTFVVAGGGFSGVEVVAELNDFLKAAARAFQRIRPEEIHCLLVHSGDRILPEIDAGLAAHAHELLLRRGVSIRLNEAIAAATADSAVLRNGEAIPTRTLVSTVPSGPVPVVQAMDVEKKAGRLMVNARLELEGHEGSVWALGDCCFVHTEDGRFVPPSAQYATREARTVARNIASAIRGRRPRVFDYAGGAAIGSLGHRSAVAEVSGLRTSGLPAWLLWRGLYLSKLPGADRKIRTALNWLTALAFPTDIVQLRVEPSSNIVSEHFEPGEVVFEQGDVGDRTFAIRVGQVEVVRDGTTVALLGPGDCFGEMALLADLPRNATVRALEPTDVVAVGRADFATLVDSFPELKANLSRIAAKRTDGP